MEKKRNNEQPKKAPQKRTKSDKITIIVGLCIIAVALVIVFLMVFVPKWMRESDMEELLERIAAPDAQTVVLVDLLPEGGNLLVDGAVQMELTGDALTMVRNELTALSESGFDAAGETTQKSLNDLVLRVRARDGSFLQLYLGANKFYYYDENAVALLFEPDDLAAYSAFYQKLEAIVAAN